MRPDPDRVLRAAIVDTAQMPSSTLSLLRSGTLDPELSALLWLLEQGEVPLVVTGPADAEERSGLAAALLAIVPVGPWSLLDADSNPPTTEGLAAAIRGGRTALTIAAADLRELLERLVSAPAGLPEDAIRRLGVVVVAETVRPGLRLRSVHYLRPCERDAQGHIQRRPPAVLAAWDETTDTYEHYAWGITPELADRVDRSQADFEERHRDRSAWLARTAGDASLTDEAFGQLLAEHVSAEPARVPSPVHEHARPSALPRSLTDPHPH